MKQFKTTKKLPAIYESMQAKDMTIDSSALDRGGDCVTFKGDWHERPLTIVYNVTNGLFGVFHGFSGEQIATQSSSEFDNEDWYRELIDIFYEDGSTYVITLWCGSISNSGQDEPTKQDHSNFPHEFRLLDDDCEIYCYGYGATCDDEAAFAPLDEVGASYGCTSIEYRDAVTGEFEEL
jgi:hypothetical protein